MVTQEDKRVIEVKGLSCRTKDGRVRILENISFTVNEGEYVVLAGPSGAGKSTLIRILGGAAGYLRGLVVEGEALVCGRNVLTVKPSELAGLVGVVLQNPASQVLNFTVEEEVAFPLENMRLDEKEVSRRVDWALRITGASHLRRRSVTELSMGELQKVVLATALAVKPKVLLLDEPAAFLDPVSRREFYRTLEDVWEKMNLTILVAEHNLHHVLRKATKLILLNKKVIAAGTPEVILSKINLEDHGVQEPSFIKLCRSLRSSIIPRSEEDAIKCIKDYVCRNENI